MIFLDGVLSLSSAAVNYARCLVHSDAKLKMVKLSIDPSEGGDDGTDAALKATSACIRLAWRVATSIVAVLTRVFILSESLVA